MAAELECQQLSGRAAPLPTESSSLVKVRWGAWGKGGSQAVCGEVGFSRGEGGGVSIGLPKTWGAREKRSIDRRRKFF